MPRREFTLYDIAGGAPWVGAIVTAGYLFGNVPFVKEYPNKIIWAMILIPGLFVLYGAWKIRRNASAAS